MIQQQKFSQQEQLNYLRNQLSNSKCQLENSEAVARLDSYYLTVLKQQGENRTLNHDDYEHMLQQGALADQTHNALTDIYNTRLREYKLHSEANMLVNGEIHAIRYNLRQNFDKRANLLKKSFIVSVPFQIAAPIIANELISADIEKFPIPKEIILSSASLTGFVALSTCFLKAMSFCTKHYRDNDNKLESVGYKTCRLNEVVQVLEDNYTWKPPKLWNTIPSNDV